MSSSLTAVVTGASSGIGKATVKALRATGWQVFAAARNIAALEELAAETGARAVACDITDAAEVQALADAVQAAGPLHALVNNAGGATGLDPVESGSAERWRAMYELNVLGTLSVTQTLLPQLRASGRGDLIFVTSTAAHGTYPGGAGYTASKHAQRMIPNTLRLELAGEPIRVIEIAPGAVNTEGFSLNRFEGDAERAASVYAGYEPLSSEDVAEAIAWTLNLPHHVNIDTMTIRPRAQVSHTQIARSE